MKLHSTYFLISQISHCLSAQGLSNFLIILSPFHLSFHTLPPSLQHSPSWCLFPFSVLLYSTMSPSCFIPPYSPTLGSFCSYLLSMNFTLSNPFPVTFLYFLFPTLFPHFQDIFLVLLLFISVFFFFLLLFLFPFRENWTLYLFPPPSCLSQTSSLSVFWYDLTWVFWRSNSEW